MQDQKDRFGEKLRLVRQARENIYFAEENRRLIKQLRARLQKQKDTGGSSKRKIYLVPVDFSKGSEVALKHAVRVAREGEGQLLLLHVLNQNIFHSGLILPKRYFEILEKQARDGFKKMSRLAHLEPGEYQTNFVWGQDSAQTIVSQAKKHRAAMIIMGSHGRTGFKRFMLGSVAERTLRYAECPVLVVKK